MSGGRPRKVGVLVRPERVEEGLRMASALPLCDNEVEVILLGERLPGSDMIATHLDTLSLSDVPVLGTFTDPRVSTATTAELAARLPGYDHVITF